MCGVAEGLQERRVTRVSETDSRMFSLLVARIYRIYKSCIDTALLGDALEYVKFKITFLSQYTTEPGPRGFGVHGHRHGNARKPVANTSSACPRIP